MSSNLLRNLHGGLSFGSARYEYDHNLLQDVPQCEKLKYWPNKTVPGGRKMFSPDVLIQGVCQSLINNFAENLACER